MISLCLVLHKDEIRAADRARSGSSLSCDRTSVQSAVYTLTTHYSTVSQFSVIRNMLTLDMIFAQDKSHVSQSCVLSVCNISKCKHQPGSQGPSGGSLVNKY